MYVADTTLIIYQAWADEEGVDITVYSNTGLKVPNKVGSAGKRGFMRARVRLWGPEKPSFWSLLVAVVNHHYT